jgi:hypothetical protein
LSHEEIREPFIQTFCEELIKQRFENKSLRLVDQQNLQNQHTHPCEPKLITNTILLLNNCCHTYTHNDSILP